MKDNTKRDALHGHWESSGVAWQVPNMTNDGNPPNLTTAEQGTITPQLDPNFAGVGGRAKWMAPMAATTKQSNRLKKLEHTNTYDEKHAMKVMRGMCTRTCACEQQVGR